MFANRSLTFMGLNAVRCLSIISLILVFASTIVVIVTNVKAVNAFEANNDSLDLSTESCDYIEGSTVPNQPAGVFWAIVSSLLIIFQTIVLLLSEVGWPAAFFDRFFPVLGRSFGLGALGIFQCLISTQILSHHASDFTLVSAFFLFAIGCLNMFLGLIFREHAKEKRAITSWHNENKGLLPAYADNRPIFVTTTSRHISPQFTGGEKDRPDTPEIATWKNNEKAGYGFGRQGEKAAGLRGFILQKPEESRPRFAVPPPSRHQHQAPVTRDPFNSSPTSSFASPPYSKSIRSSDSGLDYVDDDEDSEDAHANPAVAKTPVFRSSPTAL